MHGEFFRILLTAIAVPGFLLTTGCAGIGAIVGGAVDGKRTGMDSVMAWRSNDNPGGNANTDSLASARGLHELLEKGAPGKNKIVALLTDRDSLLADGILPDTIMTLKGSGAETTRVRLLVGEPVTLRLRGGPPRPIKGNITRMTREGIFLNREGTEFSYKFSAISSISRNDGTGVSAAEIESPGFQDRLVRVPGFRLAIGENSRFIPGEEVREIRLGAWKGWGPGRAVFVAAGALLDGLAIAFFVAMATGH